VTPVDIKIEAKAEKFGCLPTELQQTDIEDLTHFLVSVFGGEPRVWQDWFLHWWSLNPAWQASIPRGWLIRSAAGKIVAFTANIPFPYVIDGQPALCCVTGSTAVDRNCRGLGLAKAVGRKFLNQADVDLLLGTHSTDAAYGLWRSLGMKSLEEYWLRANSRILVDGFALGTALSQRARLPNFIGYSLGTCLALLLDSPAAQIRRSVSLDVAAVDKFAETDSEDIELCRASNATTYSRRDIGTLNWLYFGTPYLKRTRVVLVARANAQLLGFLAMKAWGGHSYYLLECRCRNADPDIARELMRGAHELARQNRVQTIIVRPYTKMIETAISAVASIPFKKPPMTYCYKSNRRDMSTKNWEAAPGDGDVSVN
jgi:hypothetical protein